MSRTIIVALVIVGGCASTPPDEQRPDAEVAPLVRCPLGDPAAAPALEILHLDAGYEVHTTQPNDAVPLIVAPQGGHVLYIGARATNLDGCHLTLTTSFRDPTSNAILKLDQRPAKLDAAGGGWGVTNWSYFAALAVCPQVAAERDLYDEPFLVTVSVEDLDGRSASRDLVVVPVCPENDPSCRCMCSHDYVLGGACT